jgi:hypothetical protein
VENVPRTGDKTNAYKVLFEKPQRKGLFRIPGHRWENNIKMYLEETKCEHLDWIHWAEDVF